MKYKLFAIKVFFSLAFLVLLYNHLDNFMIKYFKYASSYMINKYHFQYGYYFMVAFETLSLIVFLIPSKSFFFKIYDWLFFIYILFLASCLISIEYITDGCTSCHYFASFFFENYLVTLCILLVIGLLYIFIIRNKKLNDKYTTQIRVPL